MNEYRFVSNFSYNNQTYSLFIDQINRWFFLKKKNNKFEYLDTKEYCQLLLQFFSARGLYNTIYDKKTFKINPKIVVKGSSIVLTASMLSSILSIINIQKNINSDYFKEINEAYYSVAYNLENDFINLANNEFKVDTYLSSETFNYLYIYDMDYANMYFKYEKPTYRDFEKLVNRNRKISKTYKKLILEYIDSLLKNQPNVETRVLYENLKTLQVVECDNRSLLGHTLSRDSYGCYVRDENKIYVLKDNEYKKGTWSYQVIYHELSHCLRTGKYKNKKQDVQFKCEGKNFYNLVTAEALNSIFTVSLFDYEEKEIAYQLQSNYFKVMIECMDNYQIGDYINHSLSYFVNKLDEFNKEKDNAAVILNLMQLQYDQYHNHGILVSTNQFYPIYDYLIKMYVKKYYKKNMSSKEIEQLINKFIEKITYDVPINYNIDVKYITDTMFNMLDNTLNYSNDSNSKIL